MVVTAPEKEEDTKWVRRNSRTVSDWASPLTISSGSFDSNKPGRHADFDREGVKIRELLADLDRAGVQRSRSSVPVTACVWTSTPLVGIVIGRRGAEADRIRGELEAHQQADSAEHPRGC